MAETIVRSPHNSNPDSPLRGVSPGSRSSPSNASRSDTRIAAMRRDNCKPEPVVGSGGAAEIERALKKGMWMQFDYTITDADVGRVLTPADGFLINLSRTSATPPGYEIVEWNEGRQQVKAGRLVLRASGDVRDLVCIDTQSGGGWGQHARSEIVLANRSIRFRGNLVVIAVPKGSQWSVSISGVPVVRRPAPNMGTAFATGSNYIPRVPPAPREAVLIER